MYAIEMAMAEALWLCSILLPGPFCFLKREAWESGFEMVSNPQSKVCIELYAFCPRAHTAYPGI